MNNVTRRAIALREARDRAKDPDFKILWELKLRQLLEAAQSGGVKDDRVQ